MDLDGLTWFLVVGRLRSFTAAAAELGVTPTAVSSKIKLLEQRLGVVLFQRTTRRVALTEPGQSLFDRLSPALSDVEGALASLSDYRRGPTGTLRLTAPRTGAWLVAPIIARMRERHPELAVEVSLDDAFVDIVEAGFDAGMRLGDTVEKDMVAVRVTTSSGWSIVGAPSYFDTHGRPRTPEDLAHHQTIRQRMIATKKIYRWELERRGKELTVDVPGGIVANDVQLMVSLAVLGAGLAYVPDEHVEAHIEAKRLERVLEPFLTPGPGIHLYFPARMQEQPKLRALVDLVKETTFRDSDSARGRDANPKAARARARARPRTSSS